MPIPYTMYTYMEDRECEDEYEGDLDRDDDELSHDVSYAYFTWSNTCTNENTFMEVQLYW